MVINVHAGHCPDGKGASGAVGIIKESTEARKIKDKVIEMLKGVGYTVYDCTCDEEANQRGCLYKIVDKCNAHDADIDISIHFNDADPHDTKGDGRQIGTETHARSYAGVKGTFAKNYISGMKKLGFKVHDCGTGNDGMHKNTGLYVLNNTKAPAVLVEVCFVGDKDDVDLYKKVGPDGIARVIAEAVIGGPVPAIKREIQVGDIVKVTANAIKLYDRGDSKAVAIGTLLKDVEKKVTAINSKKTKAKLATGFWVSTKNIEVKNS